MANIATDLRAFASSREILIPLGHPPSQPVRGFTRSREVAKGFSHNLCVFFPLRLFYNIALPLGAMPMTDENDTPEAKEILAIERTDYFKIGLLLTVAILLLAATYVFVEYEALYKLKPNEFGDFLAGIFGPLVLLWVVMGFLQQGAELKYSREALLLQAKELKASVEAQQNMGEAAWAGVHAERDARTIAENDRIRALQPVFTLHNYSHGGYPDAAETVFSLANSGKDGIDLQLAILGVNFSINPKNAAKFTSSERVQVAVLARPKSDLKDCVLQLCYKDVEGRAFERLFSLQASDEILLVRDPFGSTPLDPHPIPR